MSLAQMLYVSEATKLFTGEELLELVSVAGRNNRRNKVTGLLLYSAGNFMQLLEGEEGELLQRFGRISRDPRHKSIEQLFVSPCRQRLFSDWNMGLLNFETHKKLDRQRFDRILSDIRGMEASRRPNAAVELLKEFRQQLPIAA